MMERSLTKIFSTMLALLIAIYPQSYAFAGGSITQTVTIPSDSFWDLMHNPSGYWEYGNKLIGYEKISDRKISEYDKYRDFLDDVPVQIAVRLPQVISKSIKNGASIEDVYIDSYDELYDFPLMYYFDTDPEFDFVSMPGYCIVSALPSTMFNLWDGNVYEVWYLHDFVKGMSVRYPLIDYHFGRNEYELYDDLGFEGICYGYFNRSERDPDDPPDSYDPDFGNIDWPPYYHGLHPLMIKNAYGELKDSVPPYLSRGYNINLYGESFPAYDFQIGQSSIAGGEYMAARYRYSFSLTITIEKNVEYGDDDEEEIPAVPPEDVFDISKWRLHRTV